MQVVIAAGGQGTRLVSLLGTTPKVLAPVEGTAFIVLVITTYLAVPGTSVHLLLGHRSDAVIEELASHFPEDPRITWTIEPQPLGVAGALRQAAPRLEEVFTLTYGDVFPTTPVGSLTAVLRDDDLGVILTCPVELAEEPGNCLVRDDRVVVYQRDLPEATHVDGGMVLLRRGVLDLIPEGTFVREGEMYAALAGSWRLRTAVRNSRSVHIGDPAAYHTAIHELARQRRS